jgi:hypothetical protein
MIFWGRPARVRIPTTALFAAVAWAVLAPAPAQASCGDYVTMAPHAAPAPPAPSQTDPAPSDCPCRSATPSERQVPACPGCSAPAVPQSAVPSAPVRVVDEWGISVCVPQCRPAASILLPPDADDHQLIFRPSAIYRPPRA